MESARQTPEEILARIKEDEARQGRGKLKIFLGAAAGVGKTYTMLEAAQKLLKDGIDVVSGVVVTHGRKETEALLEGLEVIPERIIEYQNTKLTELDIDEVLIRNPAVVLIDELAHTNAPGSRHEKRWQDVEEVLQAGIDVFTTLNIQHLESVNDLIAQVTGVTVRETVPDSIFEEADDIELVDLPPDDLIQRLREGKVYIPEQAQAALENFFRKGNLIALRELALRVAAERVDAQMLKYRQTSFVREVWPITDRILVCVSPSPLSARLVRAAKRMAASLKAEWTAVFVETPAAERLPDKDRNRVIRTLQLAQRLGGETAQLTGSSVSEELVKYAQRTNASKIIVGKPARPRWREILFGSVVDDVIRQSGPIDIYVITGEKGGQDTVSAGGFRRTSETSSYLWAALVVATCTVVAHLMMPYFQLTNVVMAYLLGVVIVSTRYGRGQSILASILSVAAFDFFFVPPQLTFAVSDTQYLVTFAVMLVVALVVSTLTVRVRQQAETARVREARTAALYSLSRELASTLDMNSLASIGLRHIGEVFDSQVALFVPQDGGKLILGAQGEERHQLSALDPGVAGWVEQNRQPAGLGTETLPGAQALYLPLLGAQKNIGVLAVRPSQVDRFASPEQFHLLETFTSQLASACERAQLSEEAEQAHLQIRSEQLRSSLLSSVSHDLRTPLATITGAASSIIEGSQRMDLEKCKQMASEIYDESIRLNRLVSNLLDMTKLQSGNLTVVKELHPVDEIVGAALSCMEAKLGQHIVKTKVPSDLPLVWTDAILVQQVLVNLIENAVKYTPPGSTIEISAEPTGEVVTIAVADTGPGIAKEHHEKVFEKFFRDPPDNSSGVGLGLAICSSIVEAHDGKIWVENRPGGGAVFKFTLASAVEPPAVPIDEDQSAGRENSDV